MVGRNADHALYQSAFARKKNLNSYIASGFISGRKAGVKVKPSGCAATLTPSFLPNPWQTSDIRISVCHYSAQKVNWFIPDRHIYEKIPSSVKTHYIWWYGEGLGFGALGNLTIIIAYIFCMTVKKQLAPFGVSEPFTNITIRWHDFSSMQVT